MYDDDLAGTPVLTWCADDEVDVVVTGDLARCDRRTESITSLRSLSDRLLGDCHRTDAPVAAVRGPEQHRHETRVGGGAYVLAGRPDWQVRDAIAVDVEPGRGNHPQRDRQPGLTKQVRCHDRELIRSSPFRNPAQFEPFPKQGFRPEGEPGGQGAFHGEVDG